MSAVRRCSELARNMDTAGVKRFAPLVQPIDRLDFPGARAEVTIGAVSKSPDGNGVDRAGLRTAAIGERGRESGSPLGSGR